MVLKNWTGTHPVSGSTIVGAVVILTESSNINFSNNSIIDDKGNTKKSEYQVTEDIEGEEF